MNSSEDYFDDLLKSYFDEYMAQLEKGEADFDKEMASIEEGFQQLFNNIEKEVKELAVMKFSAFSEIPPFHILLLETIIHVCICAVGFLGNIVTCVVIVRNISMRTTTNVYLFNLAVSDLIMLSSGLINYTIASWYPYKSHEHYGMKGCFFFNWLSDVAVNVSIMTITAFTIERYLALCHPFLARTVLSIPKAVKLIFVIWIIGTLFGYLIFSQRELIYKENEVTPMCTYKNTTEYVVETETLLFFILPFALMAVLYFIIWRKLVESSKIQKNQGSSNNAGDRSKIQDDEGANRQILKMLVTIVAVFFMVWAPYHFGRLFLIHLDKLPESFLQKFVSIDLYIESAYLIVYFSSSAINPIIYNLMSKKFRDAFKEVFMWNICGRKQLSTGVQTSAETKV